MQPPPLLESLSDSSIENLIDGEDASEEVTILKQGAETGNVEH